MLALLFVSFGSFKKRNEQVYSEKDSFILWTEIMTEIHNYDMKS